MNFELDTSKNRKKIAHDDGAVHFLKSQKIKNLYLYIERERDFPRFAVYVLRKAINFALPASRWKHKATDLRFRPDGHFLELQDFDTITTEIQAIFFHFE